jgi:hypothetical protein
LWGDSGVEDTDDGALTRVPLTAGNLEYRPPGFFRPRNAAVSPGGRCRAADAARVELSPLFESAFGQDLATPAADRVQGPRTASIALP